MRYTQAKECINELGREGLEELLKEYGEDVIEAGIDCGIGIENIAESYSGKFEDDETFTQDLLEQTEPNVQDLPFYIHIDWESTARDIMMDYSEEGGHYFRIL